MVGLNPEKKSSEGAPEFGLSPNASIAVSIINNGQSAAINYAGLKSLAGKVNIYTTITLGSVDIVDAWNNGTMKDVIVQTAGLGGAIAGGIIGGIGGGAMGGLTLNPVIAGGGAVAGGTAGAYFGELWVQDGVNGLYSWFNSPADEAIIPATPLNSTSFWNDKARQLPVDRPGLAEQETYTILHDYNMARRNPELRQEIAEKYGFSTAPSNSNNSVIDVIGYGYISSDNYRSSNSIDSVFSSRFNGNSSSSNSVIDVIGYGYISPDYYSNSNSSSSSRSSSSGPDDGTRGGSSRSWSGSDRSSDSGSSRSGSSWSSSGPDDGTRAGNSKSSSKSSGSSWSSSGPDDGTRAGNSKSSTKSSSSSKQSSGPDDGTRGGSSSSSGQHWSGKPVVLDLDRDGIELSIGAGVSFDVDDDGFLENTTWAAADDGFLVVDLDDMGNISAGGGDGVINQTSELAFATWAEAGSTDLQALAEAVDSNGNLIFDTNGDGILNASDDVWSSMKVWQDLDQDGEVDEGELKQLDEWKISEIRLSYDDDSAFEETDDNITVLGNTLHGLASFVMDGALIEGGVGDIQVDYAENGWRMVETAEGFEIQFETGETMAFWNAEDLPESGIDLTANSLSGATGDSRNNVLNATGSTISVVISGGAGADIINGGSGDDLLSGDAGADVIDGGAGNDQIFADADDDVSAGNVTGGEGFDELLMDVDATLNIADLSLIGFEAVKAGDGDDNINALTSTENIYLSSNGGDDTLISGEGADTLVGGVGNDILNSGDGDDLLIGGAGIDIISAGKGDDTISGGEGDDTLNGEAGNDTYFFSRGDGNDTIHDFAEDIYLERVDAQAEYEYTESVWRAGGKDGSYVNELRTGYVATNSYVEMFGEIDGGIDTLKFGGNVGIQDVLFNLDGANAFVQIRNIDDADTETDESGTVSTDDSVTIEEWTDQKNRVENFEFSDGTIIDMSQVTGGQFGHDSDDNLSGAETGDWLNSGAGDDSLAGNDGGDILIAGAGNDTLDGGAGKDFLFAGAGNDTAQGGDGNDYILGGAGDDTIEGGGGDDGLSGDAGDDILNGGNGSDILIGGQGVDTLNGGAGDDTYIFFRGDGHDTIHDYAEELQDVQEATGRSVYQRSGKSGKYVAEMRTVQKMVQVNGGWDKLQFGYSILLDGLFFDLQDGDLVMGVREFDEDGNELSLDQMSDVVTVQDWDNEMSRVEEIAFGDGLAIDVSEFSDFQSGYAEDDTLTGTSGHDLLSGGGGADTFNGQAGNDVLVGDKGDDILNGGDGDDDLYAGAGDDKLDGGKGNDYLLGGSGDDTVDGGAGDDVLVGGLGDDLLRGGTGNDTYIFNRGDGNDTIDESQFDAGGGEIVVGADGFVNETQNFTGWTGGKNPSAYTYQKNVWVSESRSGAILSAIEGGDDVLQFGNYIDFSDLMVRTDGSGSNTDLIIELIPYDGGNEIDDSITIINQGASEFAIETLRFANNFVLNVSQVAYAFTGDESANEINTSSVTLPSGSGAWLVGGAGDDTIIGSIGNDILAGSADNDRLEGGLGNDTYVFGRGDGADVLNDIGSNANQTGASNMSGDAILFNTGITIEDLVLDYSDGNMIIYVADQDNMTTPLSDLLDSVSIEGWGNTGNRIELLQFFNGLDFNIAGIGATKLGTDLTGAGSQTPIDDTLEGTALADWMDGFAGNDILNGNNGEDFIFGRDGDDVLNGGAAKDILAGGKGDDTISGGGDGDVITGGAGNDTLSGDDGEDVIVGGTGDDIINGGAGNDLIIGDLGDDTFIASAGIDVFRFGFGDGNDTYQGNKAGNIKGTDFVSLEDDVKAEQLWFERVGNDLVLRLHGAEDTMTFENWYYGPDVTANINGFVAGDKFLSWKNVEKLTVAMDPYIADLNDGTTAYGLLVGDTPDDVMTAVESAWA